LLVLPGAASKPRKQKAAGKTIKGAPVCQAGQLRQANRAPASLASMLIMDPLPLLPLSSPPSIISRLSLSGGRASAGLRTHQ